MSSQNFATTFVVEQTPQEAFAAITDVRGWWSGEIEGSTDHLGAEFTYQYQDLHFSKQQITEFIPGKKVVWHVVDAYLDFTDDPNEWTGTDITFQLEGSGDHTVVTFTHEGLIPEFECFEKCSNAWDFYVNKSLRSLITTGKGSPNPRKDRAGR